MNKKNHFLSYPSTFAIWLFNKLFGCKHREMSQPLSTWSLRSGESCVRMCSKCGARREFDKIEWKTVGPYYYDFPDGSRVEAGTGRILRPPYWVPTTDGVASAPVRLKKKAQLKVDVEKPKNHPYPPRIGEFLLYFFLSKGERVYLIGDLAQEYQEVLSKFGRKAANVWYYKQVLDSLWPLVWRYFIKVVEVFIEKASHRVISFVSSIFYWLR